MKSSVTLLNKFQVFDYKLKMFREMGTAAPATDHAILMGTYVESLPKSDDTNFLKERTSYWWTKTNADGANNRQITEEEWQYDRIYVADLFDGVCYPKSCFTSYIGVRPVLPYSLIRDNFPNEVITINEKGIETVKCGYFPSYVPEDTDLQKTLTEKLYQGLLRRKTMTFTTKLEKFIDDYCNITYEPIKSDVYEYDDKLYIRIKSNSDSEKEVLSDGKTYERGDLVWEEVSKIELLGDEEEDILLSKKILFGGIPFKAHKCFKWNGAYSDSLILYRFLNDCFAKEIIQVPKDVISKYNIIFEYNTLVIEYFNINDLDFNYITRLLISNSNINVICLKCPKFSFRKQKEKEAFEVVFNNKILKSRETGYYISYTRKKNIILLESRLRKRNTDSEEDFIDRFNNAKEEVNNYRQLLNSEYNALSNNNGLNDYIDKESDKIKKKIRIK